MWRACPQVVLGGQNIFWATARWVGHRTNLCAMYMNSVTCHMEMTPVAPSLNRNCEITFGQNLWGLPPGCTGGSEYFLGHCKVGRPSAEFMCNVYEFFDMSYGNDPCGAISE